MNIKSILVGVASFAALTGCAAQDHYYSNGVCVTCFNNPVTGEPLNYDPKQTPQQIASNAQGESVDVQKLGAQSGSVDIDSHVDVDTAYARIKPALGFRSLNDFESLDSLTSKVQMGDAAWKHVQTPGAYYDLGDYGRQSVGSTQYSILQRVQIQKNGAGSRIHYSWEPAGPQIHYDGKSMESALTKRLKSALK